MTDRTRMFLGQARTWASMQAPRTMRSMRTPHCPAPHQSTDQSLIRQAFILDDYVRILATAGCLGHLVNFSSMRRCR